jgi:mannose-1-phosphate guanylyltransferase
MKAMILAAGFGTRLRPLSDERPKALMPVVNEPVIARNIAYLKSHGVTEIIVNAHHHHEQLLEYLISIPFGVKIDVRVEPEILGTGGGIRNTIDFWDREPFIVLNGDILTNIDLMKAYQHHKEARPLATLILHDRSPYNKIKIDAHGKIAEIPRAYGPDGLAFTGIHIIEPALLPRIPEGFSDIIECYRGLIEARQSAGTYISEGHYWHDIGNMADYIRANRELAVESLSIGPGAEIDPSVKFRDWAVIGKDCHLERGVEIRRSILWEGVTVKERVKITDSVVTSGCVVKGSPFDL